MKRCAEHTYGIGNVNGAREREEDALPVCECVFDSKYSYIHVTCERVP